jgi:23S rRNA (cytidine1920-2'-O)/16S rRNA (cytidine1409-2'-O)-methyltransferase
MRADIFLVQHGFAETRAEAQAAIRAGLVNADGRLVTKPSQAIAEGVAVAYQKAHPYVSRGALKLAAALDRFALSPENLICLDLGASTGGFTQVLLERGARKVYAVDVGHGQLHKKLHAEPRLVSFEGLNARDLTDTHIREPVDAIAADVSFVSLKLALPPALALAAPGAWLVVLVKPQFEAGRENVGKGGIVKDEAARRATLRSIADWLGETGWSVQGSMVSPIEGGDGNREFLLATRKP